MAYETPVIIDNGTGYTKMGYAGNFEPCYIIPTSIATNVSKSSASSMAISRAGTDELDYFIGFEALRNAKTHNLNNPIREGQIHNWDDMEKMWAASIYKYLHVEPENHPFVLTEPPMNTPENRE
jgi:actin-related protein 3